jgi:hypothetical protein
VFQAATIEASLELLDRNENVLSLFDEAAVFLQSMGMYKKSGTGYDRGMYLEFFNGKTIRRSIKSLSNQ